MSFEERRDRLNHSIALHDRQITELKIMIREVARTVGNLAASKVPEENPAS